jgi:hypothetical protein
MRNGVAGNADGRHCGAAVLTALADGVGHFVGLAQTDADLALLVTGDDQRTEAESTTAFDDLRGTVDEQDLFRQFIAVLVGRNLALTTSPGTATAARTVAPAAAETTLPAIIVVVAALRSGGFCGLGSLVRDRRGLGRGCLFLSRFVFFFGPVVFLRSDKSV